MGRGCAIQRRRRPPKPGSLTCPKPFRLSDNLIVDSYQRTGCLTTNFLPPGAGGLLVEGRPLPPESVPRLRGKRRENFERQSVGTEYFDVHASTPFALASGGWDYG